MSKIILGKHSDDRSAFQLDVTRLIDTRLLIQASSGGGKSYLLRKLIEQVHGQVQIIILDIEGEFSTLREKHDFIVAGKGGDIAADPRSAELMALKVLELRSDLIVDLFELKQHERIRFVKIFLEAMINSPKALWHPTIVILDEAHMFAPEQSKSEALGAVVDMASRGRKRGFCLVVATQRPAKLDKDVTAECQNKIIGLGNTDIDRDRGAKELGFTSKEAVLSLRDLEPGEFFAVGPAFSKGVRKVQIGEVSTSHPKSGAARLKVHTPAPTAKIKAALAKLADLPKQAEEEIRDRESMAIKIRDLQRQLEQRPKDANPLALETARAEGQAQSAKQIRRLEEIIKGAQTAVSRAMASLDVPLPKNDSVVHKPNLPLADSPRPRSISIPLIMDGERTFGQCERKILGFLLAKSGRSFSQSQVAAMTGYANSGGFRNALSNLNQGNLIIRQNGTMAINPEAHEEAAKIADQVPHRLEDWIAKLGACERAVYQKLLDSPNNLFSKDEIARDLGYANSGGFRNALSRLSTLGLLKRHPGGNIGFNTELLGAS